MARSSKVDNTVKQTDQHERNAKLLWMLTLKGIIHRPTVGSAAISPYGRQKTNESFKN